VKEERGGKKKKLADPKIVVKERGERERRKESHREPVKKKEGKGLSLSIDKKKKKKGEGEGHETGGGGDPSIPNSLLEKKKKREDYPNSGKEIPSLTKKKERNSERLQREGGEKGTSPLLF